MRWLLLPSRALVFACSGNRTAPVDGRSPDAAPDASPDASSAPTSLALAGAAPLIVGGHLQLVATTSGPAGEMNVTTQAAGAATAAGGAAVAGGLVRAVAGAAATAPAARGPLSGHADLSVGSAVLA